MLTFSRLPLPALIVVLFFRTICEIVSLALKATLVAALIEPPLTEMMMASAAVPPLEETP